MSSRRATRSPRMRAPSSQRRVVRTSPPDVLPFPDRTLRVTTRAKVNLYLEVIRQRDDGFHEIETVLQSLDLADELTIQFTDDGTFEIACSDPDIPTDESNLCHRAVVAVRPLTHANLGARIRLDKRIPAGAGLGGGSANAAGVLLAADRAFGLRIPAKALSKVAASLGSDVPFQLRGGTMLGRGRGEILTPLDPLKRGVFLIVKPQVSIPTAWVYSHFNFRLTSNRHRLNLRTVNSVLARFPRGSLPFRNALQDVVLPAYPAVTRLLDELLDERPCFASMTGSGSAVFAVFERDAQAVAVAKRFSVRGLFTSVAKPARQAVDIRLQ